MKISILIKTNDADCFNGIAKSQSQYLSKKYEVQLIDTIENANGDILFNNWLHFGNLKSQITKKYGFYHKTHHLGESRFFMNGDYKCVVHSEIMKEIFREKFGDPFNIYIVHNYPDLDFLKKQCTNNGKFLWTTRLDDTDRTLSFIEFINYCKKYNIIPTVLSSKIPEIDYNINYIESVPYDLMPDFLSGFEYGFGVGRSLLDMSLCGLKIIPIGQYKSELIEENNIEMHIQSNFNSILTKTNKDIEELINNAKPIKDLILSTMTQNRFLDEIDWLLQN